MLKSRILDQSNQEIILEIKRSNDQISELKTVVDSLMSSYGGLQQDYTSLQIAYTSLQQSQNSSQRNYSLMSSEVELLKASNQETVPWNIRGIIVIHYAIGVRIQKF